MRWRRLLSAALCGACSVSVVARAPLAAAYELQETTPAVAQALAQRQARFEMLEQHKQAGAIGEDRVGHVQLLSGGTAIRQLIEAENADREVIYRAIVEQNHLPPSALDTVRAVFGETQRERAKPGHMVQSPAGDWMRK